MIPKAETYTCELCGGTFEFEDDWIDDDIEAEYKKNFPHCADEPRSVVCDDCYNILMGRKTDAI